ncbi:MAG: Stp1/IreP family PP2C-type Ser/Thr phosphatase [Ruminococcaceae bacterium]|nr:Stp1/IreP family PP2C-type Ser/Thr phosphatase [Oscillospiraceae bacterium]
MLVSAYTDVGSVRKVNEDNYYVSDFLNDNGFIIVADGMGGHNGGQIASKTAIDAIKNNLSLESMLLMSEDEIENHLNDCIDNANNEVILKSLTDEHLNGMGTTLVLCVVLNNKIYIANIGDSRFYAIRDNKIAQVTKDHSVVQMLIDKGEISEIEAKNHPNKNVITRAIGSSPKAEADIYSYSIKKDDYILMCTDGLSNMVDSSTILNFLMSESNLDTAVKKMGDLAIKNGGYDNITVVAVRF